MFNITKSRSNRGRVNHQEAEVVNTHVFFPEYQMVFWMLKYNKSSDKIS